jgi:hypothetical protein
MPRSLRNESAFCQSKQSARHEFASIGIMIFRIVLEAKKW